MSAVAPDPANPTSPWDAESDSTIVDELERLSAHAKGITNRDACLLISAADRLRAVDALMAGIRRAISDAAQIDVPADANLVSAVRDAIDRARDQGYDAGAGDGYNDGRADNGDGASVALAALVKHLRGKALEMQQEIDQHRQRRP